MEGTYVYYALRLRLRTPMIGTATEVSIMNEHVIEKAKKEIAQANRLGAKVNKAQTKYVGAEFTDDKALEELKGVIRTYCQLMGKPLDVPNTGKEITELAATLEVEFNEQLKNQEQTRATVFMRDAAGHATVSTHMILGNLKENLKICINSGNKDIIKSKAAVGEAMALDVKFVEDFMTPSNDIVKADSQKDLESLPILSKGRYVLDQKGRVLIERPISFDRMGKRETAIAMSEHLPIGTELACTMRVRNGSALTQENLEYLLSLAKNNGLGSWRGSGNMGSFDFQLSPLPDYQEYVTPGWK